MRRVLILAPLAAPLAVLALLGAAGLLSTHN